MWLLGVIGKEEFSQGLLLISRCFLVSLHGYSTFFHLASHQKADSMLRCRILWLHVFFCFCLFCILLAALCNLMDLSSLTRDGTPCCLHWKHRVLTTGPPGTSRSCGSWCIHREGGRWEFLGELQPGRLMWNILESISNQVMLKVEC